MQHVLVVDDSAVILSLVKHSLAARHDLEMAFAANGREALDIVTSADVSFLVLLDINMPIMNGLEFIREVTALGARRLIRIIIISTEGSEMDVIRGLEAGAYGYLKKPFTTKELHGIIDRALA